MEEIKGTPWFCSGLCCFLAPNEPVIVGKTHRDKGEVSKSAEEAAAGKVCFSFLLSGSTCSGLEQCLKPLLLVSFESNGIELIPQSLDFDTQVIRISHLALNVKFEFFSFYFFRNEVTQAAVPLADGPGAHIQALLYPGQGPAGHSRRVPARRSPRARDAASLVLLTASAQGFTASLCHGAEGEGRSPLPGQVSGPCGERPSKHPAPSRPRLSLFVS